MAHAQKPDFVFRRNGRVHLNRRGRHFSLLLAAEVCASAVVMQDTPCSEVVWSVLATHSIRQFPLNFPSRASPCAITFQMDSTPADTRKCFIVSGTDISMSWLRTRGLHTGDARKCVRTLIYYRGSTYVNVCIFWKSRAAWVTRKMDKLSGSIRLINPLALEMEFKY